MLPYLSFLGIFCISIDQLYTKLCILYRILCNIIGHYEQWGSSGVKYRASGTFFFSPIGNLGSATICKDLICSFDVHRLLNTFVFRKSCNKKILSTGLMRLSYSLSTFFPNVLRCNHCFFQLLRKLAWAQRWFFPWTRGLAEIAVDWDSEALGFTASSPSSFPHCCTLCSCSFSNSFRREFPCP